MIMKKHSVAILLGLFLVSNLWGAAYQMAFSNKDTSASKGNTLSNQRNGSGAVLDNFVFYVGRSSNYLWAGTLNGLGRLSITGQYWDSYNSGDGLGADSFPSLLYLPDRGRLIVHPQRCYLSGSVIVPAYGYGLRISDDQGGSWKAVEPSCMMGSGSTVWRLVDDSGRIYAACWYRGLAYSDDDGDSWTVFSITFEAHPDLPPDVDTDARSFSVTARNNVVFLGTDYGVYRSLDKGSTWEYIGMPETEVSIGGVIQTIYIGPWIYEVYLDQDGVLWAGCQNPYIGYASYPGYEYIANWYDGLAKSTDNGETWTYVSEVNNTSPYTLAATGGTRTGTSDTFNWFGTFAGVYTYSESLAPAPLWRLSTGVDGLPSEAIDHLCWDDTTQELWAGTQMGVALSKDYGATWLPFPFTPKTRYLDQETTFAYPNPFSPVVNGLCFFRVALARPANLSIEVYDFSGRLVKKVYNKERGPEETIDIGWDGKNGLGDYVVNGTYFYMVKIDGKIQARGKITVLQ